MTTEFPDYEQHADAASYVAAIVRQTENDYKQARLVLIEAIQAYGDLVDSHFWAEAIVELNFTESAYNKQQVDLDSPS